MNSVAAAESSVTIQKLSLECLIPKRDLSTKISLATDTEKLLKKIIHTKLPKFLSDVFSIMEHQLHDTKNAIIILKTLELDFDLDTSLSETEIAQLWADKIRKYFIEKISRKNNQNVIVFSSKALYLKALLCDLALGQAWQKWYYRHFSGLRSMPTSMAARTAILDDITTGLSAFSYMSAFELENVIQCLNKQDVRALLTSWQSSCNKTDISISATTLTHAIIPMLFDMNTRNLTLDQHIAFAFLQTQKLQPQLTQNRNLSLTLISLTATLFHLLHLAPNDYAQTIQFLREKNLAKLKKAITPKQLMALLPATNTFEKDLDEIVKKITEHTKVKTSKPISRTKPNTQFSHFGNALILLPIITQMRLENLTLEWNGVENTSAASLIRLLIVSACQGSLQFSKAIDDPLVRDLCAVEKSILANDILAWISSIPADKINTFLNSVSQNAAQEASELFYLTIAASGESSLKHKPKTKAQKNNRNTLHICIESRKGRWLYVEPDSSTAPKKLQTLTSEHASTIDQQLIDKAQADFDSLQITRSIYSHATTPIINSNSSLLLTLLAQNIHKSFAYRLPGFAHSSSSYLLRNFLCMSMTLIVDNQTTIAHTSRAPMSVLLNMTGINRGLVELPWLKKSAPHYHTIRMHEAAS